MSTHQFSVMPSGVNPDGINDWYDLDAFFSEDFFPEQVDFKDILLTQQNKATLDGQSREGRRNLHHASNSTSARKSRNAFDAQNSNNLEDVDEDDGDLSDGQRVERRDRNREHAKRSRIRKRVLLDTLQEQINELRNQNTKLRRVVTERLPHELAASILLQCTTEESTLLTNINTDKDTDSPSKGAAAASTAASGRPSSLTAKFGDAHGWQRGAQPSVSNTKTPKILMEPDYRLIHSLITSQQNFVLSDPSLPDNPIVYASDGFCRLTGYRRQDVLGRNCRFLQGPGTDPAAVEVIRSGLKDGRDVSVCLLNYKADGSTFWNQFFLGALKDSQGQVVNYVGVQCEVNTLPVAGLKDRVKKLPLPGV